MSAPIIHIGDCLESLRAMPAESVQTCVTSPPYFGLRDYGMDGQIGLEATPDAFVARLVGVFREVRRVLRDDGTLWLNLGDSYAGGGTIGRNDGGRDLTGGGGNRLGSGNPGAQGVRKPVASLKPKDLIGIPWRVAFALQADGWYLRQDIIWHKPNPMPESVTDRCTKAHEYVFLLSKSARYYFDADAIKEPSAESSVARLAQPTLIRQVGSSRVPGKTNGTMKAVGGDTRNRRSVWTVTTKPFKGAHFATFPPDLIEPCILAGAPIGGVVLDPFGGSGTTAGVAIKHGRRAVLCELNPEYAAMIPARIASIAGETIDMFAEVQE
jgi:DNA modification methylase